LDLSDDGVARRRVASYQIFSWGSPSDCCIKNVFLIVGSNRNQGNAQGSGITACYNHITLAIHERDSCLRNVAQDILNHLLGILDCRQQRAAPVRPKDDGDGLRELLPARRKLASKTAKEWGALAEKCFLSGIALNGSGGSEAASIARQHDALRRDQANQNRHATRPANFYFNSPPQTKHSRSV
jgi:hypothetical protein